MLKRPSPTLIRRVVGIVFSVAVCLFSSYTVWAIQPEWPSFGNLNSKIAIRMKWLINDVDALKSGNPSESQSFVVVSGKEFVRSISLTSGDLYETRCVASLPNMGKLSPKWELIKASGKPTASLILLECRLSNNATIFSTPSIAVRGGKPGSIEVANKDGSVISRLELTASTSTFVPTLH